MSEIDTTGDVWIYRPYQHKLAHKNKNREVIIGPRAQQLVREFAPPCPDDYLFSPRLAVEAFRAARAASRRTPLYPSHQKRNERSRVRNPKRQPGKRYKADSYGKAIVKAIRAENRRRSAKAAKTGATAALIPTWHPNQLRHTFATETRKKYGLEAAQVLLGHARADVTQVYAERNRDKAIEVAKEIG